MSASGQLLHRRTLCVLAAFMAFSRAVICSAEPQILFVTPVSDGEVYIERLLGDGQYRDSLVWKHNDGTVERVNEYSGDIQSSAWWAIGAAFTENGSLAVIQGNVIGVLEYRLFEKQGSTWTLPVKAALGSGTFVKGIQFDGLRSFEFTTSKPKADRFVVTDQPRAGDAVYRHVLKNGEIHKTPEVWFAEEIKELAKKQPQEEPVQRSSPHTQPTPDLKTATNPSETAKMSSEKAALSVPSWLWLVMGGAAIGLLWMLLKKRVRSK